MRTFIVLLISAVVSGCEILGIARECKTYLILGLSVTPVDSATNGPVQSDTIVVTATDGSYADTAMITGFAGDWVPSLSLVERPGTFRVEVKATGYRTWTRKDVRVTEADACGHLRNVKLTAFMQE